MKTKTDLNERYEKYMESKEWSNLKKTMPGPRQCFSCQSSENLQLHHMQYPEDIYATKHHHCCWLCGRCHRAFHSRVPSQIRLKHHDYSWLRKKTIRIIKRALRKNEYVYDPMRSQRKLIREIEERMARDS